MGNQLIDINNIKIASNLLNTIVKKTPLQFNGRLSDSNNCSVWLKREDLQEVRSFKIRGAFNKIYSLKNTERKKGVVCSSAGNHAQGFAKSCMELKIKGTVFMPTITPKQKIEQVKMFGGDYIKIVLEGDTYDDTYISAKKFCDFNKMEFIHPFDDVSVIEGQATLALEILSQKKQPIDYIIVPIGGGGLISGILSVFKELSPKTKIIGVEPKGAPSMKESLEKGKIEVLKKIDPFVDGAAVKKVGEIAFKICQKYLDEILLVPEGKICQTILEMYNKDAIVVEPAGALSISGLELYKEKFKNKNIVCLLCGSNNDISRMSEIKEKALLYSNLKHYFLIKLPQRAGALKEFVSEILGPNDDITHFEYTKKNFKEKGVAVVGIECVDEKDLENLLKKMKIHGFYSSYLNDKDDIRQMII
ncbi:MAG: threonine dehydratase [Bacteroidetes bacterium MED-G20]|nr:MAG: threonine dehydratase [Bacteroidetes bacterium MED-G20]